MSFTAIQDLRKLSAEEILGIPVSSLAYLGDAVYEMYVRERLVRQSGSQSGSLFKTSLLYVEAKGQAAALDHILGDLSEDELGICRRARNHSPHSRPRHSDPVTYRKASAFEALCAWLWLQDRIERLEAILEQSFTYLEERESEDE